jgi:hypothetical protein
MVHISADEVKLVTVHEHSNQLSPAHGSWAEFGPVHAFGPGPAHFQKKLKKILFNIFDFLTFFIYVLFNFSPFFFHFKNINPVSKYPLFIKKTSKNTKKI